MKNRTLRFLRAGTVPLVLLLLAPTLIHLNRVYPAWDDSFFLHRALTLGQKFWSADPIGMRQCLAGTFKSPIMAFLAIPWGPMAAGTTGPALLFFTLAVAECGCILISIYLMWRARVSPFALLWATVCVAGNPIVLGQGGTYLVDSLLSWIVLSTVLLIPFEIRFPPQPDGRSLFRRGAIWGVLLCAGLLCKVTYLFFAGLTYPTLLYILWRRHGSQGLVPTVSAARPLLLAAGLFSLPALVLWLDFGGMYWKLAMTASFGEVAKFYAAEDATWFAFWSRLAESVGISGLLFLPLGCVSIWHSIRTRQEWTLFVPAAILAAYLVVSSMSSSAIMRQLLPVMIAMPYATAVLWRRDVSFRISRVLTSVVLCMILLACVLETRRPQLDFVVPIARLVVDLKGQGYRNVVVATDSPRVLNIDLVILAKVTMGRRGKGLHITSIAYDDMHGLKLAQSLKSMDQADIVLFEYPLPETPNFTNKRSTQFLRYAEANMERVDTAQPPSIRAYARRDQKR